MITVLRRWACSAVLALGVPFAGQAKILHVHTELGNDASSGSSDAPFRSLRRAVEQARPGDTIRLLPGQGAIREAVLLVNRSGETDAPITLDGGGNWLTGCDPIDRKEWEEVSPGLYRNTTVLDRLAGGDPKRRTFVLKRFFLVVNGRPNRMNRSSKGNLPALPAPESLRPGEWTANAADGSLYFRTALDLSLDSYHVEIPVRQDGFSTRGSCAHWVVRNLHIMRFWNDGFNFHGTTKAIRLENITALDCGDDGMSLHGSCEADVSHFLARGNSTGACHIEHSSSTNEAVDLRDNHGLNLFVLGSGTHVLSQSIIGPGIRAGTTRGDSVTLRLIRCELPPILPGGDSSVVEKGPDSQVEILPPLPATE